MHIVDNRNTTNETKISQNKRQQYKLLGDNYTSTDIQISVRNTTPHIQTTKAAKRNARFGQPQHNKQKISINTD